MELVRQTAQGTPEQGFGAPALSTGEESFSQLQTWTQRAAWGNSPGKEGTGSSLWFAPARTGGCCIKNPLMSGIMQSHPCLVRQEMASRAVPVTQ